MAQALKLGKSVNDLGYGMFLQQLQYKSLWKNKVILEADKWFASSKTCCKCGLLHKGLSWSERVFAIPSCGFKIDRDHNAALNLKNYGLKQLGLGRPDTKPVETSTHRASAEQVGTLKQEAPQSVSFEVVHRRGTGAGS